jgi:hypothetical protein
MIRVKPISQHDYLGLVRADQSSRLTSAAQGSSRGDGGRLLAMRATGVIFAALDCDADVIEAWNRWYDLEHTPPNLLLDGIMQSRRYVAPPALHEARLANPASPYSNGRATFLTIYWLTGDPAAAFKGMVSLREQLAAAARMAFPDDKKAVRDGDVFEAVAAVAHPITRLVPDDAPFVGHTGLIAIQRHGNTDAGRQRAASLIASEGVLGVWTLQSLHRRDLELDLVFVEGDTAAVARQLRDTRAFGDGVDVIVDAPYQLIDPLRYPWADDIRRSTLPAKVGPGH